MTTADAYTANKGYLVPQASLVTANDLVSMPTGAAPAAGSGNLGRYSLDYADKSVLMQGGAWMCSQTAVTSQPAGKN